MSLSDGNSVRAESILYAGSVVLPELARRCAGVAPEEAHEVRRFGKAERIADLRSRYRSKGQLTPGLIGKAIKDNSLG